MKVLSKSKFKLGLECPNKLYYSGNPIYANSKIEDPFLLALANGGFQVEALARLHYPNGIMINTNHYEYEKAAQLTFDILLRNENVVIYEAAFLFENYFVRTDILVKEGKNIKIIEVKAKSFDSELANEFLGKKGGLTKGFKVHLFDLSFQKWVIMQSLNAFNFSFNCFLMMADKSKTASVNGLNQMFRLKKNGNPRTDIIQKVDSIEQIGQTVLGETNVDEITDKIIAGHYKFSDIEFKEHIQKFRKYILSGEFAAITPRLNVCKKCEFKLDVNQGKEKLSGFEHCFKTLMEFSDEDFKRPLATEVWNLRAKDLVQKTVFMSNFSVDDFPFDKNSKIFTIKERQWTQINKINTNDKSLELKIDELKERMNQWVYPLHCIDFETATVALPFNAGRRSYEQIAFQFSHHVIHSDGSCEHKTEYINVVPGKFPNFEFARALKQALGNDSGSIFKYATHENTIVNSIIEQLENSNEVDKIELIQWLETISILKDEKKVIRKGDRNMIDLCDLVKKVYYNPATKGSNSIKFVLPAILKTSNYLREKYSKPIKDIKLTSCNFNDDHIWFNDSENPYNLLPKMFSEWDEAALETLVSDLDYIKDGGAALTAYAKLQYTDMEDSERQEIKQHLLKYCELDTLSMVMLIEHFKELINE
jgi:hypothetical protein